MKNLINDFNTATDLEALAAAWNALADACDASGTKIDDHVAPSDAPTFGGAEPKSTIGVWSWDVGHVLVNGSGSSVQVVERGDIDAKISEAGNGFPDVGDYVTDGDDLYRVATIAGTIHTDDERGNYVFARLDSASWDDCTEGDEHPCHAYVTA